MKLYEISNEVKNLENLYLDNIDKETGELKNVQVLEQLEVGLMKELKNKGIGIIKMFQNEDSVLNAIDNEIERLVNLKMEVRNKRQVFRKYIISNMERMNIKKIETPLGSLSISSSTSTEIYDDSLVPNEYKEDVTVTKIDKNKLKKDIKNGVEVQGARLVTKSNLRIK